MSESRGLEFSAKTLARRITTMKVFFGWLHGIGTIGTDPAEPIVHVRAQTPLPTILRDADITRLLRTAQDGIWDRQKPDVRPYLLISLLLQTGIKKAECARLHLSDLDVSRPQSPTLTVRYAEDRHAHKNRTLTLNAAIVPALQQYLRTVQAEGIPLRVYASQPGICAGGVGRKGRHPLRAGWLRDAALDVRRARLSQQHA